MSITADDVVLVSREGYERLRATLARLTSERLPELADELREARADERAVDENGGLLLAIDDHAALERRILELRDALSIARIAEPAEPGCAGIGARIRIRVGDGRPLERQLVGPLEAGVFEDALSLESPIGRALAGRRAGESVTVETPGGTRTVELLEVR